MKRVFLTLTALMMAVSMLTACSASPAPGESEQQPAEETTETTETEAPAEPEEPEEPELPVPRLEKINADTDVFSNGRSFVNGYDLIRKDKQIGYMDTQGKVTMVYDLTNAPAEAADKVIRLVDWGDAWVSEEGLYPHYDVATGKWGFGNIQTGEVVIAPKYDQFGPFASGCAVGVVNGQCEVIDTQGNILATPAKVFDGYLQKEHMIVSMSGDKMPLQGSGKMTYVASMMDAKGQLTLDQQFLVLESGEFNGNGFEIAHIPHLYNGDPNTIPLGLINPRNEIQPGIYDLDGNFLYKAPGSTATAVVNEGITMGNSDGDNLYYYIKMGSETPLTEEIYQTSMNFSDGRCWVLKNDESLYSLIDDTGKEVIPPSFNNAQNFKNGYALVLEQVDGFSYLIDKSGNPVFGKEVNTVYYRPNAQMVVNANDDGSRSLCTMQGEELLRANISSFWNAEEGENAISIITKDPSGNYVYDYYRYIAE